MCIIVLIWLHNLTYFLFNSVTFLCCFSKNFHVSVSDWWLFQFIVWGQRRYTASYWKERLHVCGTDYGIKCLQCILNLICTIAIFFRKYVKKSQCCIVVDLTDVKPNCEEAACSYGLLCGQVNGGQSLTGQLLTGHLLTKKSSGADICSPRTLVGVQNAVRTRMCNVLAL